VKQGSENRTDVTGDSEKQKKRLLFSPQKQDTYRVTICKKGTKF